MKKNYIYLTMTVGARAGENFVLDPTEEIRLGRGMDCDVVLTDPLSSRVHAVIAFRDDGWWIRDTGSRNGTYVNDSRIDQARLDEGSTLRVGTTEFAFRRSDQPPTASTEREPGVAQTIIKDAPMSLGQSGELALSALNDPANAQDMLLLYQLSIRLLRCDSPDQTVRIALDLLHERTRASVVGFLWINDEGVLVPKVVIPEQAGLQIALNESLTEVVCRQMRAVWIANQAADDSHELERYADGVCVPLVHEETALGAIHVYLEQGRFRQNDFDFAISLANIVGAALVRARQQASLAADHERLVASTGGFEQLIGESPPMQQLKSKITRVAKASGCVLLRGESGAGKELVAAALHKASPRADRPMLSINCAAIPADLMESQLFGHKKGAFTGADRDHEGLFQQADTGTLFLDEVGEMTLDGQAKLLRVLEGHPFLPVGSTQEVNVDVRVIAATNRDLQEFVREKRFREDLFYRLSVFELPIPPLRERGDDIDRLIDFFLDHFRRQHGRPELAISAAAREKLNRYAWPGNVRQLRNVIDSTVVLADGEAIEPADLPLRDAGVDQLESLRLDHWEKKLIGEALNRTGGNVPEAAKLLGIGRATVYRKLDEYDIQR